MSRKATQKCWGREAVNTEDHTTLCGEEEPAYRRSKAKYAQRERERGTKNISIYKECNNYKITITITTTATFTKGYKVTFYSD